MKTLTEFASLELHSPEGETVPLGRLWRGRTIVLTLVRHFG